MSINQDIQIVQFTTLKKIITEIVCHPIVGNLIGIVFRNSVPSHGLSIDTTNISAIIKAYLFWGIYESAEIRFIKKYLRTDLDTIELGSSLGVVSCSIANKIKSTSRLICVEANPEMIDRIRRNLELNNVGKTAEIIHGAISYNGDCTTDFFVGQNNLVSALDNSISAKNTTQVSTVKLSSIIDKCNVGDYSLVCDIEGAEIGIFLHDKQALIDCQQIIIELHKTTERNNTYSVDMLVDLLVSDLGFCLTAKRGSVCVFEK